MYIKLISVNKIIKKIRGGGCNSVPSTPIYMSNTNSGWNAGKYVHYSVVQSSFWFTVCKKSFSFSRTHLI